MRLDSDPPRSGSSFDAEEPFLSTLHDAVHAADASGVPWVLMGGVGSAVQGRPRWTHDIDLFVTPRGAGQLLNSLADAGFKTEEHDPNWLFKGWKNGILVDVIFRSSGSIYLDDEMVSRATPQEIGMTRCGTRSNGSDRLTRLPIAGLARSRSLEAAGGSP